ncbi:MAG: AbrB/MazE/SpoVT family DNA-binding domain-containing protein [Sebaldella sp.]|nr:AbrB/MazE/SpoVT family DNA-binding domain-containing protein [Sebaldella sp.]
MSNIIKIGNSYGSLIPKKILDTLDIKLGDEIDFEIKENAILIKKHEKVSFREKFIKSFQDNGIIDDAKDWEEWQGFEDEL